MRITHGLVAMLVILFFSACNYTPDKRAWTDIAYPAQAVRLEIENKANMNNDEIRGTEEVLIRALHDLHIDVHQTADRKLLVEIVKYNEQSAVITTLRWISSVVGLPLAHYTSNVFDLRARLVKEDGTVVEFTKLAEISESGREFKYLQENMARRVAYAVLTADALARAHELGYD